MLDFIKNLLPRLKGYSKELDRIEVFVDKPWVLIDDVNDSIEYEFARDGRLIIDNNGDISEGTWEYRPVTNYLIISNDKINKISCEHAFVSDSLLALKKRGTMEIPLIFYNRNSINLDIIQSYLASILKKKTLANFNSNQVIHQSDKGEICIHLNNGKYIQKFDEVYQGSKLANQGRYILDDTDYTYIDVSGGMVTTFLRKQ